MLNKIIIIDFDDSFTYNIASTLYEREQRIQVIHHKIFFKNFDELFQSKEKIGVILGPGPGHPEEYKHYLPQIKWLMEQPHIYVMGICLGHQILGTVFGHQVKHIKNQVHGVAVDIEFNGINTKVQRYNSLGVFIDDKEQQRLSWPRGESYQFHPESVGTENNLMFFKNLLQFLEN